MIPSYFNQLSRSLYKSFKVPFLTLPFLTSAIAFFALRAMASLLPLRPLRPLWLSFFTGIRTQVLGEKSPVPKAP